MEVNFNWTKTIIMSCTNYWHMEGATNMVHRFREKYPKGLEEDHYFELLIEALSKQKANIPLDM